LYLQADTPDDRPAYRVGVGVADEASGQANRWKTVEGGMKRKPAWRYTCDHCGKNGYSASHMAQHEKACTKNPDRICRMCEANGEGQEKLSVMTEVLSVCRGLDPNNEQHGATIKGAVDDLRELAHGCPACMLAAIRQSAILYTIDCGITGCLPANLYVISRDFFDYKAEKEGFWKEINEANAL